MESLLGRNRNAGNTNTLPKVELASASEFLAVIDETGAFDLAPSLSSLNSAMRSYGDVLEATAAAVVGFPNHATPFRDTWTRAIQVFSNSKMMTAVIAQRMSGATDSKASGLGEASVSDLEPVVAVVENRRRRASI